MRGRATVPCIIIKGARQVIWVTVRQHHNPIDHTGPKAYSTRFSSQVRKQIKSKALEVITVAAICRGSSIMWDSSSWAAGNRWQRGWAAATVDCQPIVAEPCKWPTSRWCNSISYNRSKWWGSSSRRTKAPSRRCKRLCSISVVWVAREPIQIARRSCHWAASLNSTKLIRQSCRRRRRTTKANPCQNGNDQNYEFWSQSKTVEMLQN